MQLANDNVCLISLYVCMCVCGCEHLWLLVTGEMELSRPRNAAMVAPQDGSCGIASAGLVAARRTLQEIRRVNLS